jgi:hypothetical protein
MTNPIPNITVEVVAGAVLIGMLSGIFIDVIFKPYVVEVANAQEVEEPKEVRIEVIYDWTPERIEQEIRTVFWEDPDTAVKIAKCESGLVADVQSNHTLSYGRERSYGLMQIHAPAWHTKAVALGYDDYQTDVLDNLHMARYIYEQAGKRWTPWSCYSKKMI